MEQQSSMEDKEEVQVVGEVTNERDCGLQESDLPEDKNEEQTTGEDSSNVCTVPKSNGFLFDTYGEPFEDNIIDSTARREPISACIDSDSDVDSELDSSSSSVSSLSSFSSLEDLKDTEKNTKATRQPKSVKTKGELGIEDLPPVAELTISVPEDDMQKIGKVYSIVDQLVVIESHENSPPLDLDSVLFLFKGKPLGHVFDVFGPVKQPYYLVRFNSNEDIINRGISKEDSVFYAPSHSEVTNFIFTDELMRQKGSDASWEHNNEPPEEHIDFSDDEKELAARKKRVAKSRKPTTEEDAVVHKKPNTSFEGKDGRDASTPDVTVLFASKNSNYFRRKEQTGNSASYSPMTARPYQRTSQNAEVKTLRYGSTKNFSWSTSSHSEPQQRMPFQQTLFQRNPSPAVYHTNPPSFTSVNVSNQNAVVTPPCTTPMDFSLPPPSHPGMPQRAPSQQAALQQSPVHMAPATPINTSSFTFNQRHNQNAALSYRTPQNFSLPPPSQQGPPQEMLAQQWPPQAISSQQWPPQGMPIQQGPPQGVPTYQWPPQRMPTQQGPPQGVPIQQGPPQGVPIQQGPPQGVPIQQGPPQGVPIQQGPPQGVPIQQGPPQGVPIQQGPPQGVPIQQGPPQGMPIQQGPPQGMLPLQGVPPQQEPLQSMPPQQILFQQNPMPSSSHTFSVNPTNEPSINGGNKDCAPPYRTQGAYSLHDNMHITGNNSHGFMPGISERFSSSGSSFSSSSFLGSSTAPPTQWPAPSPGPAHFSGQQCLSNQNSFVPTSDQLQSYDKNSTKSSCGRFQMKVSDRFSFTEKAYPRFGAPAALPPSGLYHSQPTNVQTRFSPPPPTTNFWNIGKT